MNRLSSMEQQTDSWLEWRRKGVGASDAPVVMGVSPWRTSFDLWEEKTGRLKKELRSNWAMERGNQLEPKARAHYELACDIDMPPTLVEHSDYPVIRASLDGWNPKARRGLEIKCPGEKDHSKALYGEIPEKYYPQVQHQIMITNAKDWDYFSFDGKKGIIVRVLPDKPYIQRLLKAELKFWDYVKSETEPPLTDKDYKIIKNLKIVQLAIEYKQYHEFLKQTESSLAAIKEKLARASKHPRIQVGGLRVCQVTRKGNVDYSKVPELKDVDLNPYRKVSGQYTKIEIIKEKK